ncbi:hypothetical protein RYX36_022214 [Vicia faba]
MSTLVYNALNFLINKIKFSFSCVSEKTSGFHSAYLRTVYENIWLMHDYILDLSYERYHILWQLHICDVMTMQLEDIIGQRP